MKKILFCLLIAVALLIPAAAVLAQSGEPGAEGEENPVVNVAVPANLNFTLDPYELAGRGQVYCDGFEFVNYGDANVILTIADYEVIFANETDFRAVPYEIDTSFDDETRKAIRLVLTVSGLELVLTDTAAGSIDLPLAPGETVSADISGSMNPYPAKEWRDGDVRIKVNYRIDAADPLGAEPENETPLPVKPPGQDEANEMIKTTEGGIEYGGE
jgi:hypothetical protein